MIPGSPGFCSTRSILCIVISRKKKKLMLIWYSQECQNTKNPTTWANNSKTHAKFMKKINISCKTLSSLLALMISNQEPLSYVTAVKLGLIPTEGGTRSSVITSYFKVNKCRRCKLENRHHSGEHYFYLTELMGNASCHSSFCTNPSSICNISTSASHWTGQTITHHLGIWI